MSRLARFLVFAALTINLLAPAAAEAAPRRQTVTPSDPRVARIVSALTPDERVGQLFVVTFAGPSVDSTSPVFELIAQNHIGGVALLAANDNFADTSSFAGQLLSLTRQLQSAAAGVAPGATAATSTPTPALAQHQFIPLFIAAAYSDENYPGNSLLPELSGLTPLPSAMTVGATWSAERAKSTGEIAGMELSALGINMLFGPTLDVVETPQPSSAADLGARAFGGDPYWVGLLGKAFIEGVHHGSDNRMAVVASHFPGYGASDRALDDQVPTVSKSLAQLTAIDLAPFFAVTKIGSPASADALLVSHIRYRGFQGNIRDTTRPISFDQQALGVLLGLPEFSAWHENGGLTMSDALGLRGVRRFYDVTGRTFPAFNIARDAFLAGNDVLYLSQFGLDPAVDQPATIKAVLAQFVQKYEEDPAFATRVDQAVSRIIALKIKMYGEFALDSVLPTSGLDSLAAGRTAAFAAARDAATLISPAPADLADRLPAPPTINQQIVFFTDTRLTRQCSVCASHSALAVDSLQQAVLRLYGPQGSGEAIAANVSSFSFAELVGFLEGSPPLATPVATPEAGTAVAPAPPNLTDAMTNAEWLVFAMLDVKSSVPTSNALNRVLAERPELLRGKRVVVFAFDAPYYLDTTEAAQLTAYYGLYNKSSAAVEVAARILFQELTPTGASPVSIPAVGYNLIEVTQPDPKQVIQLFSDAPQPEGVTPTPPDRTPTPPAFAVNNLVALRTGEILDRNGHPVPDGTVAQFFVTYVAEGLTVLLTKTTTVDGIARASLRLDRIGLLEVSVTSEPALSSYTLQFNAQEAPSAPVVITPTPGPTDTLAPTEINFAQSTDQILVTPTAPAPVGGAVTGLDLILGILAWIGMSAIGWRLTHSRSEPVSSGVKLTLMIAIGIWASYDYYALGLPGAMALKAFGVWAGPVAALAGGAIALAIGWWWLKRKDEG